MQVWMASEAAGAGRVNEDFLGSVPGAVLLLDGAGIVGAESLCRHGVTWFVERLGSAMLVRLSRAATRTLTEVVAESIDEVAAQHRGCDLADPSSPQATVMLIRVDDGGLDYLALGDSFLAVERSAGEPVVITDQREIAVRRECSQVLDGLLPGSPDYDGARARCIELLRASRNQPGGYWIAKDDPEVVEQAVVGRLPATDVVSATLLSNGASRIVDPYQLCRWQDLPGLLRRGGPDALIRSVRQAEAGGRWDQRSPSHKPADDASVAYCSALCK
jgi:hypothetical protein